MNQRTEPPSNVETRSPNSDNSSPGPLMRLWLEAPDWQFRLLGILFFGGFVLASLRKYALDEFWNYVPYCQLPNGFELRMPWVPILVDLTFLIMLLSFLVRLRPQQRASNGWVILYTLLTAFLPLIFGVWLGPLLGLIDQDWQIQYENLLIRDRLTWYDALLGGLLLTIGNALDVWGYFALCRSFSIVPEARELKTSGPYRVVRHPVYLGQFLAQAGVWLFVATLHYGFVMLYATFVVMQLFRSKLEDDVLEKSFGEEYLNWKEQTFWFV